MDLEREQSERVRAGRLALVASVAIFAGKLAAFGLTGSSAIFSDALESVVNVVAAGLLLYSLMVAARPPDPDHPYGHGKVEFFSAGVEGTLIGLAALAIFLEAGRELVRGPVLHRLDAGLLLLSVVSAGNAWLGVHLVRTGRRTGSLALVADGRHVLADVWTSLGVLVGLAIVRLTGWVVLDPLVAMAVALNVLRTGWALAREAVGGLMDEAPDALLASLAAGLDARRESGWIDVHSLRAWRSGSFTHVDLHMVVPRYLDVDRLHAIDDQVEQVVSRSLAGSTEVIVHFDPCRPRLCPSCEVPDCPIREAPFRERLAWSHVRATRRDELLESGVPVPVPGRSAATSGTHDVSTSGTHDVSTSGGHDAWASGSHDAFVALGSNLGDRAAHLRAAAAALAATPGIELVACSRLYETDPVGPPPQGPYLNAAVQLRTVLAPEALLARLLEIEREQGRERSGSQRNAARTLDLDLLDYDGRCLSLEQPPLELPHPHLHERAFVLEPLAELAGERVHPRLGERFADLAARVRDPEAVHAWRLDGGGPWPPWP